MKIKYLSLLAFSFMVMLSCADDNAPEVTPGITPEIPNDNKEESVLTFTGIIEGTNSARTAFGQYNQGEYGVFWTEGDNISVYTKSGKLQSYNLTDGAGSDRGTFTFEKEIGDITAPSAHYAVYPYTLNSNDYDYTAGHDYKYSFSGGKLTLDLSNLAEQTHNVNDDQQGDDKFQLTKSIMTAKSTDTTLKFENALAMLHVNICAGEDENYENFTVHTITLSVDESQSLWGAEAQIDMNSTDPTAVVTHKNGCNVITMKMPEGGVLISEVCAELGQGTNHDSNYNYNLGGRDFYILLPAGTYSNFKIDALVSYEQRGAAEDGTKKFEFNLTKRWDEITFERSYINSFHRPIDALISYNGVVYADILDAYEAAVEDGNGALELRIARPGKLYWPFFECYEYQESKIEKDVHLDGENQKLTIANPNLDPVYFTSDYANTTIENLIIDGEISLIGLGQYMTNFTDFTTVLNNVKVSDASVNFFSNGAVRAAMFNYGVATLNDCEIIGNKKSPNCPWNSSYEWKAYDTFNDPNTFTYDLGAGNKTKTILNGGKYGNIITWEYCYLEINRADVEYLCVLSNIHHKAYLDGGFKVDGTEEDKAIIGKIDLVGDPGNYSNLHTNVYIGKNCTIDILNLTSTVVADNTRKIVIEDLSVINKIDFGGKVYTEFSFKEGTENNVIVFGSGENTEEFTLSLRS